MLITIVNSKPWDIAKDILRKFVALNLYISISKDFFLTWIKQEKGANLSYFIKILFDQWPKKKTKKNKNENKTTVYKPCTLVGKFVFHKSMD